MRMEEHFVAERVYPESEIVSIAADSDKHRYTYADAIDGPTNQIWCFPHLTRSMRLKYKRIAGKPSKCLI
jgi:hypothetical protein